jgi:hypothetical protein
VLSSLLSTFTAVTTHTQQVTNRQDALLLEDEAAVMCSAPYRPPELMHINPGMVLDERIDVWALVSAVMLLSCHHCTTTDVIV